MYVLFSRIACVASLIFLGTMQYSEAGEILVSKRGVNVFVVWQLVKGWPSERIKQIYGPQVFLTEILSKQTPFGNSPTTSKDPPSNPWCQCPIGYAKIIKMQMSKFKLPLSGKNGEIIFGKLPDNTTKMSTVSDYWKSPIYGKMRQLDLARPIQKRQFYGAQK